MDNSETFEVGDLIQSLDDDKYVVNKIMYGAFEPSISLVAAADGAKSVWDIDSMLIWFRKVG